MAIENPRADPLKTLEDLTLHLEKQVAELQERIMRLEKKHAKDLSVLKTTLRNDIVSLHGSKASGTALASEITSLRKEMIARDSNKAEKDHRHSAR